MPKKQSKSHYDAPIVPRVIAQPFFPYIHHMCVYIYIYIYTHTRTETQTFRQICSFYKKQSRSVTVYLFLPLNTSGEFWSADCTDTTLSASTNII